MTAKSFYDDFKEREQQLMVLQDRYCALARALGFEGDGFWGDVFASHQQILETAWLLRATAIGTARSHVEPSEEVLQYYRDQTEKDRITPILMETKDAQDTPVGY